MPLEEQSFDSMPVQLTRMEGLLNLIDHKVDSVGTRMDRAETNIDGLQSLTQSLKEGAASSEKTATALALALKEAKETAENTAHTETVKAEAAQRESDARAALGWTPITRLFAVVAVIAIIFNLYQGLTSGTP